MRFIIFCFLIGGLMQFMKSPIVAELFLLMLIIASVYLYYVRRMALVFLTVSIALFFMPDQGGGVFYEVNRYMRYATYLFVIGFLLSLFSKFYMYRLAAYVSVAVFYIVLSLLSYEIFSFSQALSDFFVYLIPLFLFVGKFEQRSLSHKDLRGYAAGFTSVCAGSLFVDFVRVVLGLYDSSEYLSYDSLKVLYILPSIFILMSRKYMLLLPTIAVTLIVFNVSGTRMIPLVYVILMGVTFARLNPRVFAVSSVVAVILVSSTFVSFSYNTEDAPTKVLHMIALMRDIGLSDPMYLLQKLDYVRHIELNMFISDFFGFLFGSGFGQGFEDIHGLYSSVAEGTFAFSDDEIRSGVFYGFHDSWVDIGFRFGILFWLVLFVSLFLLAGLKHEGSLYSVLATALYLCAFYSIKGLLLLLVLIVVIRLRRQMSESRSSQ